MPEIKQPGRRIVYLQGSVNPGGSKRSLLNLLELLQGTGYEAVVVCPGQGWLTEQLSARDVPFVVVPFLAWRKWLQRPWVGRSISREWLPALSRWEISLVHSNEFWWAPHAAKLARHLGIPAVVHLRDGHHTLAKARQYQLPKAQAILAVSTALRDQFASDPVLLRKTEVLFNAHDERVVRFQGGRREARAQFNLRPDDFVIGNAGQVCDRKNQRFLLERVAELRDQVRLGRFQVLLAGEADAEYAQLIRQDIERLHLQNNVQMLGPVESMSAFYASLDLLVHCAKREGLPRVLPEAMLAGCPVVATEAEGVKDAIPDPRYGMVVPNQDGAALAAAILQMAENPSLRAEIAGRACQRAEALFGLRQHREAILEVYGRLLR